MSRPRPRPAGAAGAGAAESLLSSAALAATIGLEGGGGTAAATRKLAPVAHLQTLQKRLVQLQRSLQEVEAMLFTHPTLEDW